jgi:hypothetical protein
MKRVAVLTPEQMQKIIDYVNIIDCPFQFVEKATEVKQIISQVQIMDAEEKPNE